MILGAPRPLFPYQKKTPVSLAEFFARNRETGSDEDEGVVTRPPSAGQVMPPAAGGLLGEELTPANARQRSYIPGSDTASLNRQATYLGANEEYNPIAGNMGAGVPKGPAPTPAPMPPPAPMQNAAAGAAMGGGAPPPAGLLGDTETPPEGLLSGGSGGGEMNWGGIGNKVNVIGRLLSAASKGWMNSLQPGQTQGLGLGMASTAAADEFQNINNEDYERRRQEILDRIEAERGKGAAKEAKQHILPPGAILTDAEGKELRSNPALPKEPKEASGDALLVQKLADPNLPPAERKYWEGIYNDKTRAPAGQTINLPGPTKMETIKLPNGDLASFNPVTGEMKVLAPAGPPDATKGPEPKTFETSDGKTMVFDPTTQTAKPLYEPPPEAPKAEEPRELNATELKALGEAQGQIGAGEDALRHITRAKELNEMAVGGPTTPVTKYFDYFVNPERYNATEELETTVLSNAVTKLKALAGPAPTDKDLQIIADIEGSVRLTPEARRKIFETNQTGIEDMIRRARTREADIRKGTYGMTDPTGNAPSAALKPVKKYNPATGRIE